ncbi:hypothetical protein [Streptomyces sp. NPDC020742]|uniref:hypothetical protein n=1 Tax=Streptomyces sp. NPDC020742 TaxID=3154897 RepID=UPI0033F5246A
MTIAAPPCPFCGLPVADDDLSMDHVFGDAFGARAKVPAHRSCNNQSGGDAEGRLHHPNSLMNLVRWRHGKAVKDIPATFSSGRTARINPSTGVVSSPHVMVNKVESEGSISFQAEGTQAQVEAAYEKWRSRHPDLPLPALSDLPTDAFESVVYESAEVSMKLDLQAAQGTAVKAALGACTLAYGPSFTATPLAAALRAAGQAPPAQYCRVAATVLDSTDALIAEMLAEAHPGPMLVPREGSKEYDVILLPAGQETVVFVHILSTLMPPYGIKISAPVPGLSPGVSPVLPVLLREDADGRISATDFTEILMDVLAADQPDSFEA